MRFSFLSPAVLATSVFVSSALLSDVVTDSVSDFLSDGASDFVSDAVSDFDDAALSFISACSLSASFRAFFAFCVSIARLIAPDVIAPVATPTPAPSIAAVADF